MRACALGLVSLAINLAGIGTRSLLFDEASSVRYARSTLSALWDVITGGDPNMSLYYLLLHAWVGLFGESEAAVRSLSAGAAACAVPALYGLGRRLFSERAGVTAALLLALNPFFVQYAQNARSYALLVALVTLSSYLFVGALRHPSVSLRWGYAATTALAIYAHYVAAYAIVVHVGALLATRRRALFAREWWTVAVVMTGLSAPALVFAARGDAHAIVSWIEDWSGRPSVSDVLPLVLEFTGESRLLLLALLMGGTWASLRAAMRGAGWPHAFVAAWLFAPLALCWLVSQIQPTFLAYYLIFCVPALVLFGAASIDEVPRPSWALAWALLLMTLSGTQLVAQQRSNRAEGWREMTAYVVDHASAADGVLFFPDGARKPFAYYQRRLGASIPAERDGLPDQPFRVWLVIRDSDASLRRREIDAVRSRLTRTYHLAVRQAFPRLTVERYELTAGHR